MWSLPCLLTNQYILNVLMAIAIHTNSISVGMCQGFSAVLLPQLQQENSSIQVDSSDASWIASIGVVGTPGGAVVGGVVTELAGRRAAVQLTALPFLLGWITIALASTKTSLCVGRFITGFAIGMASACYVYVAEITSAEHRGFLSALGPMFVSVGILLVYYMGYVFHWHSVALGCALVALVSFALIHFLPESPPWLASKGRFEEAELARTRLRFSKESAEPDTLAETYQPLTVKAYFLQCLEPTVWKPFIILVVFFLCQEGSGMYVVLYYATDIFQEIGSDFNSSVESILLGAVRLGMSGIGSVCVQKFNRKGLAMASGAGMAVAMAGAAGYLQLYGSLKADKRPLPHLPFFCVVLNVCSSMLGLLQLPWLMIGELFPLSVRGAMSGIVSSLAYLFIFATVKLYPDLVKTMGLSALMWTFAALTAFGVIFIKLFLPETRGKLLIDIENSFRDSGKKKLSEVKNESINRVDPIFILSVK